MLHLLDSTENELKKSGIRLEIIFLTQMIFIVLKRILVVKLTQCSETIQVLTSLDT
jgi:hypothetical protein